MKVGYARVSTIEQDPKMQLQALEQDGCDRIFREQASGSTRARPVLDTVLDVVRAGDTLVVWKLDRLGRSVRHLLELAELLQERNVELRSLTESIDTGTPVGRMFFVVTAAFAECERALIVERGRDGMAAAKAAGKHTGRPPALTPRQVAAARKLLAAGETQASVAATLGVSRWTVHRATAAP